MLLRGPKNAAVVRDHDQLVRRRALLDQVLDEIVRLGMPHRK